VALWLELPPQLQSQSQHHLIGASVSTTTTEHKDIKIPRIKKQLENGIEMANALP
jgi:hypothetical protein